MKWLNQSVHPAQRASPNFWYSRPLWNKLQSQPCLIIHYTINERWKGPSWYEMAESVSDLALNCFRKVLCCLLPQASLLRKDRGDGGGLTLSAKRRGKSIETTKFNLPPHSDQCSSNHQRDQYIGTKVKQVRKPWNSLFFLAFQWAVFTLIHLLTVHKTGPGSGGHYCWTGIQQRKRSLS